MFAFNQQQIEIIFQDENFHLYDVKNRESLETLDLSIVQVGSFPR